MGKFIDLTGKRFGRWTVIGRDLSQKYREPMWICKCDCGKTSVVDGHGLRRGTSKSCGCYASDWSVAKHTKHGKIGTRIYNIWQNMKRRCAYKEHDDYWNYGGRGIKVCDEWIDDFSSFYKWAKENGYNDELQLDRIDFNGNYCPENCRWVTTKEQARNKRTNIFLTYNGETKVMSDWAKEYGIHRNTLDYRIKSGWSIEKALTTPVKKSTKAPVSAISCLPVEQCLKEIE